jgi:hypothetical protein
MLPLTLKLQVTGEQRYLTAAISAGELVWERGMLTKGALLATLHRCCADLACSRLHTRHALPIPLQAQASVME